MARRYEAGEMEPWRPQARCGSTPYIYTMDSFLSTFLPTLAIIGLVIAGFAIKMFFKSDGEFRGGCASNNPMLRNEIGECTVCGDDPNKCEDTRDDDRALPSIG